MPPEVAPLLGRLCRELSTAGDGACALHAVFGTPDVATEQLRLGNARDVLRNILGEVSPQVRTEMEHVLDTAVSGLWTDFVCLISAQARRCPTTRRPSSCATSARRQTGIACSKRSLYIESGKLHSMYKKP